MKIKFWWDSGVSIKSANEVTVAVADLGFTAEEWGALSNDEKYKEAEDIAYQNGLEIGFEEIED